MFICSIKIKDTCSDQVKTLSQYSFTTVIWHVSDVNKSDIAQHHLTVFYLKSKQFGSKFYPFLSLSGSRVYQANTDQHPGFTSAHGLGYFL